VIDRELYLPQGWLADPQRCQAAGVPDQVGFATKPELARVMLERALDAGVPAGWVTADEVYSGSPALRGWLEDRQLPYVLAVKATEPLPSTSGPVTAAARLAGHVPAPCWLRISTGLGAKGRRWYAWSRVALNAPVPPTDGSAGCWCAAAFAPGSWRSTPAPARPACRWSPWSGSPDPLAGGGGACRPARACAAWTSTRSAAGAPDTAG